MIEGRLEEMRFEVGLFDAGKQAGIANVRGKQFQACAGDSQGEAAEPPKTAKDRPGHVSV